MFDITATSNHWVVNPRHNLGLQLSVETLDGKCRATSPVALMQPVLLSLWRISVVYTLVSITKRLPWPPSHWYSVFSPLIQTESSS